MKDVMVVIGSGQIGQAIARRVGTGKHVLLADMKQENANAAAEVLGNAGYEVSVATVECPRARPCMRSSRGRRASATSPG